MVIRDPQYKTAPRKTGLDGMMEMLRVDAPEIINPPQKPKSKPRNSGASADIRVA
jgi:hypothetical protein